MSILTCRREDKAQNSMEERMVNATQIGDFLHSVISGDAQNPTWWIRDEGVAAAGMHMPRHRSCTGLDL